MRREQRLQTAKDLAEAQHICSFQRKLRIAQRLDEVQPILKCQSPSLFLVETSPA